MLPAADTELIQIVDAALADAALRSGHWLACRPGCNQCCTGVFRISLLDAERLRQGLAQLFTLNPERWLGIQSRSLQSRSRLSPTFPGDRTTGLLSESDAQQEAFESFGDDEVCPVLNPLTGTCDLYEHRPITCRSFGPPVRTDDGAFGVCELCFQGASSDEVVAGELRLPLALEGHVAKAAGLSGETVVAFALGQPT